MKKYILLIALAILSISCQKDVPSLKVSFSFTKETFEVGEPIGINNTTVIENDEPSMWKWTWQGGSKYGKSFGNTLSFDAVGDYEITLEVKTASGLSDKYSAKAKVVNDNILPVADFTWSPSSGIKQGDSVTFTDCSTDADGEVTAWEWHFGNDISTEKNPVFTALESGDIPVTLTVTDDHFGKASKTATVKVAAVAGAMELVWSCTYDTNPDADVVWTSPAMSPDGSSVNVISSGYKLASVDAATGTVKWSSDLASRGASARLLPNDNRIQTITATPSVDSNGNIYAVVGFCPTNEDSTDSPNPSGIWSLSPNGSTNWYVDAPSSRFRCICPVIAGDYLAICADCSCKVFGNNFFFLNKNNGTQTGWSSVANGSIRDMGTVIAVRNENPEQDVEYTLVAGQNNEHGSRVYYAKGTGMPGQWAHFSVTHKPDKDVYYYMGWHYISGDTGTATDEISHSGQMCAGSDGSVYALYDNVTGQGDGKFKTSQYGSILYGYGRLDNLVQRVDTVLVDKGNLHVPNFARNMAERIECKWVCGIKGGVWSGSEGNNNARGTGPVFSPDGNTLYVTSCDITSSAAGSQEGRITAVNAATGTVLWEHEFLGNVNGVCAVDNDGFIYYCDYKLGDKAALVKVDPSTGKTVDRITLGKSLRSSPTIAADGSIYCNGMTEEGPTLFKVKGSATSYAQGVWSQLCGGPRKAGTLHN